MAPSAGARSSVWAATATPMRRTCSISSSRLEADPEARDRLELVERPARVREPAARHLGHRHVAGRNERRERDRRLVADAAGRVLVDDASPERADRSSGSPESSIAVQSSSIAASASPRKTTAMHHALICSGATSPARNPFTSSRTEPGGNGSPSRVRSIRSGARASQLIGVPGGNGSCAPSHAATVAPTSANQPSWRGPLPCAGRWATSSACSRE